MKMMTKLRIMAGTLVLFLVVNTAVADIAVVVSSESPVTELSAGEIVDIYLGNTNRFPQGSRVVPIDQDDPEARAAFYSALVGKSPADMKRHWSRLVFTGRGEPPRQVRGPDEVRERVANNPNAIGYIDRDLVDESLTVLTVIRTN